MGLLCCLKGTHTLLGGGGGRGRKRGKDDESLLFSRLFKEEEEGFQDKEALKGAQYVPRSKVS